VLAKPGAMFPRPFAGACFRGNLLLLRLDFVFPYAIANVVAGDAQGACGLGLVPIAFAEGFYDHALFAGGQDALALGGRRQVSGEFWING